MMVTARSEAVFDDLQAQFDTTAPEPVLAYYNRNWCSIRDIWFTGPQCLIKRLNSTTNNRLESISGKLKSVIKRHSSQEEFVPALFAVLQALSDERDHKAANSVHKRPTSPDDDTETGQYQ